MQNRIVLRGALSAIGGIFLSLSAIAQTSSDILHLSLPDLMNTTVITSSKYEQIQGRSPSTITVITADDIRAYGYASVWDALKTLVGSVASDNGNTTTIGFRGIAEPAKFNSRILWLIDGHTMNDSYFQRHFPDYRIGVDMENIKQIEVIRGPASVLYGSNAFSGIVNIVTRSGSSLRGLQVTAHGGGVLSSAGGYSLSGSQELVNSYSVGASYGTVPAEDMDVLASITYRNDRGQVMYVPYFSALRSGAEVSHVDFREGVLGFARVRAGEFSLTGQMLRSLNGMPMAGYGSDPNSKDNRVMLHQGFVEAKHQRTWSSDVRTMARVYFDDLLFEATWSYDGDPDLDRQSVPSRTFGGEANVTAEWGDNRTLAGMEIQKHRTSQTESYPSEPTFTYASYDFYNYALYLQNDYAISPELSLDLGMRYEFHEDFGGILVGKGALVYQPRPQTVLRLQYGTGFNNPLLHDYFYFSSDLRLRNDSIVKLARERARTFEFVWEASQPRLQSTLSLYYSVFDRFITITSQDYYDNLSGVRSLGAEYELRYVIAPIVSGYANGTLQRTVDSSTEQRIPNVPAYSIKAGVALRPLETGALSTAIEAQHYGKADFREIRSGVHFDQKSYTLVNMNIRYAISEMFVVAWGLGNVFNTAYRYPPSKGDGHPMYGNGRTFILRADVRL